MELGRNGIMARISLEWKWGRKNHSHFDVWLCIGIGYSTRSPYDIWWWVVSGRGGGWWWMMDRYFGCEIDKE